MVTESAKYDLREFAQVYDDRMLRPGRRMALLFGSLGPILLLIGIGMGATDLSTVGSLSVAILITIGALITIVTALSYRIAPRPAIELEVSDAGLRLLRMDGKSYAVGWGSKRNAIEIGDVRSVPNNRTAPGLQPVGFVLAVDNVPVQGPIPFSAVLKIVETAQPMNVPVRGWSPTPPEWGKRVYINIP